MYDNFKKRFNQARLIADEGSIDGVRTIDCSIPILIGLTISRWTEAGTDKRPNSVRTPLAGLSFTFVNIVESDDVGR